MCGRLIRMDSSFDNMVLDEKGRTAEKCGMLRLASACGGT